MSLPDQNILNIIGIGGNSAPPNPRCPAYILPALIGEYSAQNLLLVTSLNGAVANAATPEEAARIKFNTEQKLLLLQRFITEFFPGQTQELSIDYGQELIGISSDAWLCLWNELERTFSSEEQTQVTSTLERYRGESTLDAARVYAIQHAFWFKDICLPDSQDLSTFHDIRSLGGPQEGFFSWLREKCEQIPDERIELCIATPVRRQTIQKLIFSFVSRAVQYGQATRKSGNRRISLELTPSSNGTIVDHYLGDQQRKAGLDTDIELILRHAGEEAYQTFWDTFAQSYQADQRNI